MKLDLQSVPYQPFLVAIFIGTSIYTPNRMYFPVEVMILPIVLLLCLIGISLAISKLVRMDQEKVQIFISCFLILNFTYYPVYDVLTGKWLNIAPATIIYPILLILLIAVLMNATNSQADNLSRVMNVIAISLLLIGLANIGYSTISDAKEMSSVEKNMVFESQFQGYLNENLTAALNTRDFYFIILDGYPGEDIFNATFGSNNNDFIENLTSMGFNVLRKSKSNYGATGVSIPSMLNMDYLDSVKAEGYNEENNRLWRFFKAQGFKFIFLPSNWPTTVKNDYADVILNPYPIPLIKTSQYSTFQEIMFIERTFLGKIYYSMLKIFFNQEIPSVSIEALQKRIQEAGSLESKEFAVQRDNFELTHPYPHINYTFDNLTKVPKIQGKKFVFAHLNSFKSLDRIREYNPIIESTVHSIISKSENDPVIVLMSDHGIKPPANLVNADRRVFGKYACLPNMTLDQDYQDASWYLENNLQAFYLPDGGNCKIYSGMTPVNAWRIILNYYFNTEFPRTEDRSYWMSQWTGLCEIGDPS